MDAEHLPLFVAWVLRTNRLMAADPALRKQGNFATAFHGGGWPASVDLSGVSRWETGLAGVPYAAVRRYEELLELPADSLVAPIDTLNRYLAPRLRPEPALRRPARPLDIVRHDHLADIIDRGSSGASVSGHEWDELTAFLATTPQVVLPKPSTATVLAERRLLESLIADGIAWMSRYEALNRMLAHPVFGTPAVVACASMGIDSQNPVVVESLSDLDSSAHPDASRVVISQLLNPASDRAFYGALMSSVRKSRYGHFSPVQEEQLVRVLTDLVLDGGADGPQRQLAAQVLRIVRSSL
ncbi:MAG: hypothetical protein ACRDP1_02490, partial [Nocardioidaceae bacterium]